MSYTFTIWLKERIGEYLDDEEEEIGKIKSPEVAATTTGATVQ